MADKSEDFSDVRAEETSRGRKQPVKAGALHRKRAIRRLSRILDNPKLDLAVYLEAICELELSEDSDEYRQLLELWRKRRGSL